MSTSYIIGHRKPDVDSVVSAMALAYLYSQQDCFGYQQPQAAIVNPLNPETNYLFKKFEIEVPLLITADDIHANDQVILVDHNEISQRLEGLNEAQIVEIVDHHKANLNFNTPIFLNFKPWGSTVSIIYFWMNKYDVVPDKKLATLMLAAILSDTVGLKSATTTKRDIEFSQKLANIAEINDVNTFTLEIFKAKSNIATLSNEEIIQNDYKIYEFNQKTFIGQLETAMNNVKKQQGVELLFVAVTDVLNVNTKLLLAGEKEAMIAQKAFGGTATDYVLDIGPKMSRKKEIAPVIEAVLKDI